MLINVTETKKIALQVSGHRVERLHIYINRIERVGSYGASMIHAKI
jgi:hypothetical protein